MATKALNTAKYFSNELDKSKPDVVLIRADRFEMLPIAMVASYKGIPIVHLEGGDLSGAIDNKVRHAISQLADYHFCTNNDSKQRLIQMGISEDRVWNFGSLDVEVARSVEPKTIIDGQYIFVAFHPIEGEDENELGKALENFENDYKIVVAASNADYGRKYGTKSFSPADYFNLMRGAACLVGNSSSFLKEASILGVPVVNVGERQTNRLRPNNVVDCRCSASYITYAIKNQLGKKYDIDLLYFQPDTARRIASKLQKIFL